MGSHLDAVGRYSEALNVTDEALQLLNDRAGPDADDTRAYLSLVRSNAKIGLGEPAEGLVEARQAIAAFTASSSRKSDLIMSRLRARVAAARAASAALSREDAIPIVAAAWDDLLTCFRERPVVFSTELALLLPLMHELNGGGAGLGVPEGLATELAAAEKSWAIMAARSKEVQVVI
jgi:hypothetical protein